MTVLTLDDARKVFETLSENGATTTTAHLLFAHLEIRPDVSRQGFPIISSEPFSLLTHAQLNDRWEFSTVASTYDLVDSGEVLNVVTQIMRLTQGKLLKQHDWEEWQASEFLQLDQYDAQGMFGSPVVVDSKAAVFHSVWMYAIKAVDGWKKARWACDGLPRSGQATVIDETYANCVDPTSSRLFYAISEVENMLIFGADVSNAFAEAPPPKQGFYIHPDRAFHEWWVNIKSARQYLPIMLYPFCRLCKDTQNLLVCGRSMQILSSENWDSCQQCMNHACTQNS